ncbi:MAG: P-loop NTPase, partial [Candidatus Izemoplasmatales bacterium]|nr:P-loop NTPase [Candidatus Izemoplasmatales bacterium]
TIYRSLGEPTIISAKLKPGTGSSGLLVTEVKKLLEPFQNENEYAVIDGPPGIGCPVIASLKNVDFALIVTEPSLSGLSDLKRVITMARQFKAPMAIIINKHDLHEGITKQIEVFAVSEHIPLIGKIPYDEKAILMLNRGMTIDQTTSEMSFVIKELLRKTVELMD